MALGNWHRGKLVILWSWGIVVMAFLYVGLAAAFPATKTWAAILVILLAILMFAVPLALSVITWLWFSAKEP